MRPGQREPVFNLSNGEVANGEVAEL